MQAGDYNTFDVGVCRSRLCGSRSGIRLSSRSGISCALLDRAIGSGADQADTQSLSKQTNSLGVDWCAGEWERAETGVRAGPFSCGNDLERASRRFATSGVEVYIMFGAAKKLDVRADVGSQAIVALNG